MFRSTGGLERSDPTRRRGRLIKFHGCAIHATLDPASYRRFLTGSQNQITFWPRNHTFTAVRNVLVDLATNSRTLMIGLSLQDSNLQDVFADSRAVNPWPWPPAPPPQAHVFCGNGIGHHQATMLRVVYQDAYGPNRAAIEAGALIQAYAKQALLGLVLHLLGAKLWRLAARGCGLAAADLEVGIRALRDVVASLADGDRLAFVKGFIGLWSRGMSLFRRGELPPAGSEKYEVISTLSAPEMETDPNIAESGLPELAVGLGLLGTGHADGKWMLAGPAGDRVENGIFQVSATETAQIFFVRSAPAAIRLIDQGALKNDNDIILHSDDAYLGMPELGSRRGARTPTSGVGRRTGRRKPHHVSMKRLIREATDFASLRQRFEEELAL
jgi:SIR2-like domain